MSMPSTKSDVSWTSVLLLPLLLAGLGGWGGAAIKAGLGTAAPTGAVLSEPLTIVIAPRDFSYRAAGDYYKNGVAVDGPMQTVSMTRPLTIMKYQVSNADYALCVEAGACAAAEPEYPAANRKTIPATGISYGDAQDYASWLSQRTGAVWTLPTDEELAFAAGSRFPDDALGADQSSSNPAERWLANYAREAQLKTSRDPDPKPAGHFGENEFGFADFGGNIWEWTTTCSRRIDLGSSNPERNETADCGIYHAIGKHRAPMVFFVRNPKGGGCAVGTPPDNLGFRLVKDTRWYAPLFRYLQGRGLLT
ncbi:formylglycine-generating enzyme family protein [Hyphomicrobium sp. LHD-15]|uniref:formylglycine-generating enzyme family protein n=1 Tax=Hyphomicrobium sp. LHD-15 TaxID=3072142 RepID=UPI00280E9870|nr:formylglycine-generating enzyme family protein [Hyphomicrobium sp. LHD-15]MDQ8698238.1 formylglycine-generating enzyme family protein [Hyphomicrobium sp. LHD-15]